MTYVLVIWTVVAMNNYSAKADWRVLAEFSDNFPSEAQKLCENAARQLALKTDNYRCVRTK